MRASARATLPDGAAAGHGPAFERGTFERWAGRGYRAWMAIEEQTRAPAEAVAQPSDAAAERTALVWVLAAVFATEALAVLAIFAYGSSYLLRTLDAPASYPAIAVGLYGFVKLAGAPVAGWLADRTRPAVLVAGMFALEAAGLAVVLAAGTAEGYLAGSALVSTGIALAWLLIFHALGAGTTAGGRGAATSYVALVSAAALGAGYGASALVEAVDVWRAAFVASLVLAAASAVTLARGMPARRIAHTDIEPLASLSVLEEPPPQSRVARVAAAVLFVHSIVIGGVLVAFGPFALRVMDLTLFRAGVFMAPAVLVGVGAMVVFGRRSRQGARLREAALLYAFGAAGLVAMSAAGAPLWFALTAVPAAVCVAGTNPVLNAGLLDAARAGTTPGRTLGWLLFAQGAGSAAGPAVTGAVIEVGGVRAAVLTAGIGMAVLTVLALWGARAARL